MYLPTHHLFHMAETDFDSALLTPSQRKALRGKADDISDRGRRAARARARKRTRIALLEDIPLLVETVDPEELFDTHIAHDTSDRSDDLNRVQRNVLFDALRSMVALAYRIADVSGLDAQRVVEEGVEMGQKGREEMLLEKFRENPSEMTLGEIETLVQQDLITREERNDSLGALGELLKSADSDDDQDGADADEK